MLLFIAPQAVLFRYLWERLPDPQRPRSGRWIRLGLVGVFALFDFPWLVVAGRVVSSGLWGIGRIPFLAPWVMWQVMGWVFCTLVVVYVLGKTVRGVWWVVRGRARRRCGEDRHEPRTTHHAPAVPEGSLSRRRFLAKATYAYAGAGLTLSAYGIWNAGRLPQITRRRLVFPDLPAPFDGLRILHL